MHKKMSYFVWCLMGVMGFSGESQSRDTLKDKNSDVKDNKVLCIIGKRVIKQSDIDQILQQILKKNKEKKFSEEDKNRLKDDYITMCQLSEWAKSQKLDALPETVSALDQVYVSAALRKLAEGSEQVGKSEIEQEIKTLKEDPDVMESVAIETVIVNKAGKSNIEDELKKLKNLGNDSEKVFPVWAKKFQIDEPNGEYKVNEFTKKMLKSNSHLNGILQEMQVGEIKVVPLNKDSSLVMVVRFMKKGVRTSENVVTQLAVQNMRSKKMQELLAKIKKEFPAKEP
ncbi:hypothetical protein P618_200259 [Holospora obtusa F1]|uniref:Uncharacterized protein n=1 Tax=Holospora obtusa F1 TaxID=1399147 RepID=W6TF17_HOLOB|nr:hypothetical protein [Holospora obtusa]ETZ07541.1 hypothetical protein P618_200259 [Holospora obtusa F1]